MLASMYYKQGRLDFARTELEKYVTTAPASVPGNTMLGTVLDLQGKKTGSEAALQHGAASRSASGSRCQQSGLDRRQDRRREPGYGVATRPDRQGAVAQPA